MSQDIGFLKFVKCIKKRSYSVIWSIVQKINVLKSNPVKVMKAKQA